MEHRTNGLICLLAAWLMCSAPTFALDVDSILNTMTTREKATLLIGNGWGSLFMGIGMPAVGQHPVPGAAGETRAIERLGIPSIILSDGPAGVRIKEKGRATMFPTGISLAAMNDTALVEAVGRAMGKEARSIGVDVLLGPGMNLMRNPLCGRNYEYYSENPERSAATARAMIRGLQSAGCAATPKHFAMNCQETNRMHNNVVLDSATMQEVYLRNFHDALADNPWCLMSSYNKVNGTHVARSSLLLDTILRQQWGYDGVVMTDWMFYNHVADRVAAGNDLIMPGMDEYIGRVMWGVRHGKITEQRLNEAARRVLTLIKRVTDARSQEQGTRNKEQGARNKDLTRLAGAKGCVLLKNDNQALPITREAITCAGITSAQRITTLALYGANAYRSIGGGTGSGYVNCDSVVPISDALLEAGFQPVPSIAAEYADWMRHKRNYKSVSGMSIVSSYMGRPPLKEMPVETGLIAQRADSADAAVVVIGRQAGEGHDRHLEKDWLLNGDEQQLIRNVCSFYHARGKKVIVVLNIDCIIEAESWADLPDAILCCWCPGQEVGHSVVDVLTGKVAPTGTLPLSWPRRWEDLPSSQHFPNGMKNKFRRETPFSEGKDLGYRYYQRQTEVKPLWPYGFGLTYQL